MANQAVPIPEPKPNIEAVQTAVVQPWTWTPADLATVSLTAATVVLAAVAIIVAVLTIFGWRNIVVSSKKAGADAAEKVAKQKVDEYLKGTDFHDRVRGMAREIVVAEITVKIQGTLDRAPALAQAPPVGPQPMQEDAS